MIECNARGGVMVIAGLGSGFAVGGVASLFTRDDALPVALASLVALPLPAAWDLAYRRRHRPDLGWRRYVIPHAGGSFMFLPVWLWFAAWPVVGLILWRVGVL
jgi:hypothetical protein